MASRRAALQTHAISPEDPTGTVGAIHQVHILPACPARRKCCRALTRASRWQSESGTDGLESRMQAARKVLVEGVRTTLRWQGMHASVSATP